MIVLDRLLLGGIRFVLDKIAAAVDSERNDARSLREELLAAQMRLELGELSEQDFAELERDVLARLREIREAEQGAGGAVSMSDRGGVEVEVSYAGEPDEEERR